MPTFILASFPLLTVEVLVDGLESKRARRRACQNGAALLWRPCEVSSELSLHRDAVKDDNIIGYADMIYNKI